MAAGKKIAPFRHAVVANAKAERLLEEVQGRFIRDEKLTGGKKPKNVQAKMTVDAVAAAVILKEYLDRPEQTAE